MNYIILRFFYSLSVSFMFPSPQHSVTYDWSKCMLFLILHIIQVSSYFIYFLESVMEGLLSDCFINNLVTL